MFSLQLFYDRVSLLPSHFEIGTGSFETSRMPTTAPRWRRTARRLSALPMRPADLQEAQRAAELQEQQRLEREADEAKVCAPWSC